MKKISTLFNKLWVDINVGHYFLFIFTLTFICQNIEILNLHIYMILQIIWQNITE